MKCSSPLLVSTVLEFLKKTHTRLCAKAAKLASAAASAPSQSSSDTSTDILVHDTPLDTVTSSDLAESGPDTQSDVDTESELTALEKAASHI